MTQESDLWPGDFYKMRETLPAEDQALLTELPAFLEARVAPEINAYWIRAEFPHHLVPEIACQSARKRNPYRRPKGPRFVAGWVRPIMFLGSADRGRFFVPA